MQSSKEAEGFVSLAPKGKWKHYCNVLKCVIGIFLFHVSVLRSFVATVRAQL